MHFASFVYPLRLAISDADIYAFVECICPLRDALSDFVCSSRSQIRTQVEISRKFCCCPLLAHKGITGELNHCYLAWQPFQMVRCCYPLLRREFFHILVLQSQISEILTILLFCFCSIRSRRYIKHARQCFICYQNIWNFVKNIPLSVVFSTLFSRRNTISHV